MADPRSTLEDALDGGVRGEDALVIAANLVSRWAPVPDPEPSDYDEKAAAAERAVFRYLKDTGGYVSGKSLSGVTSKSYQLGLANLRAIVRGAMGDYYQGDASLSVAVDSSFTTTNGTVI